MSSRPKGTGCVYQRPDSQVWWIKYSRSGKPFRESSHTTDKRKAAMLLKSRLAEIQTGSFVGPYVERVRLEELAEDFLREYRINERKSLDDAQARWILHLKPFFGVLRAADVGSQLIARYVDSRQQQKAKNATINRELAALKRMFRLGLLSTPPKVLRVPMFPKLKENNIRKGFLEGAQHRKMIEAVPELWFRTLIEIARTYGWRISELLNLRVRQVDVLRRIIRLEPGTTKNGDGRTVTLTSESYALLSQCIQGKKPDDFVLTRPNGKPVRDFRSQWTTACNRAGCPDLLFHDLRRTAARNMRAAGIAEGVIMKIGGWRTRSVFERYAIVTESDMADAMQKLEMREKQLAQHNGHVFGHVGQSESKVAQPVVLS